MLSANNSILALDVGGKRIGVALANAIVRIASPLITLENGPAIVQAIKDLIKQHDVAILVCGLPRGLDGQRTAQTKTIEDFVKELQKTIKIPLYWQDEAVTSRQAEAELQARAKSYRKEDIDALAATYILEDFLNEHPEIRT
jgi:putative holliday junction resolvase